MRQLNVTFDVILDDGEPRRLEFGHTVVRLFCIFKFNFNDELEKRGTGYRVPNFFVPDMQADTP